MQLLFLKLAVVLCLPPAVLLSDAACSGAVQWTSPNKSGFVTFNSSFLFERKNRPPAIRLPHLETCTWPIRVPPGKFIRFHYDWMVLKWCLACQLCDSVEITNLAVTGVNDSKRNAKLCTPSAPAHFFTTVTNEAKVIFNAVERKTPAKFGFNLTFEAVDAFEAPNDTVPCRDGHNASTRLYNLPFGATGAIYSYRTSNGTYRSNEHCSWHITASDPYAAIRLELVYVDIEDSCSCYDSIAASKAACEKSCQRDYLEVYDGTGDDGSTRPLVMKRCGFSTGRVVPCTTVTSWNEALVVFHTNNKLQYRGFILIYEVVEADQFPCTLFRDDWKVKHQINGTLKPSGTVASYKRYRDGCYRVHTRCRWVVDFFPMVLSLKFLHFDLGGDCRQTKSCLDRFRIDDLNVNFYGSNYPRKTFYLDLKKGGNAIDFDTLSAFGHLGWNFSYLAVHRSDIEQCAAPNIIDATRQSSGTIRNYVRAQGTYRTPDNCSWHIIGPKHSTIAVTVRKLAIDRIDGLIGPIVHSTGENICKNHLTIHESANDGKMTTLTGPLCGYNFGIASRRMPPVNSSGNEVVVTFTTNDLDSKRDARGSGFEIFYEVHEGPQSHQWDVTTTTAIIASTCFGVLVVCTLAIILTRRHYNKKAEQLRQRRTKIAEAILGETYIIPLPYYQKILDDFGCKEYGEIVEKITILREQIQLAGDEEQLLGEGRFGTVTRAVYTNDKGITMDVAVKTLKENANSRIGDQLASFLREGLLMHLVEHDNILKVYGIVLLDNDDKKPGIVFPYMANGNLHDYLQTLEEGQIEKFTKEGTFVDFCKQMCSGMCHLAARNCIHRDLACRNVLVSGELCLKISDFGFARELSSESDYYRLTPCQLVPYRWYPPEVFREPFIFTTKSDVWSFGILCWEIFETPFRHIPYEGKSAEQVMKSICRGDKLARPKICPENLYHNVLLHCWQTDIEKRPTFAEIAALLKSK